MVNTRSTDTRLDCLEKAAKTTAKNITEIRSTLAECSAKFDLQSTVFGSLHSALNELVAKLNYQLNLHAPHTIGTHIPSSTSSATKVISTFVPPITHAPALGIQPTISLLSAPATVATPPSVTWHKLLPFSPEVPPTVSVPTVVNPPPVVALSAPPTVMSPPSIPPAHVHTSNTNIASTQPLLLPQAQQQHLQTLELVQQSKPVPYCGYCCCF